MSRKKCHVDLDTHVSMGSIFFFKYKENIANVTLHKGWKLPTSIFKAQYMFFLQSHIHMCLQQQTCQCQLSPNDTLQ